MVAARRRLPNWTALALCQREDTVTLQVPRFTEGGATQRTEVSAVL